VKNTLFYLWYYVLLHSGSMVEVEAAAACSEIPLYCPYVAGPRRL